MEELKINSSDQNEESEEPSVLSENSEERKLARKLRFRRRAKALKSQERKEDEIVVADSPTEQQITASEDVLQKLLAEGDEVISNVKIANDAREVERRRETNKIRENVLRHLEENAGKCLEKYEIVNGKWDAILKCKDPLDIHAEIESQNAKCLEILEMKDEIISELKGELEKADLKFIVDQKKQNEDINLIIERIENQTDTMDKVYERELKLIKNVLEIERKALLDRAIKKWDTLYEKSRKNESDGIETRKKIVQEYETEMEKIMSSHYEDFRAQKISLETEHQMLQQQILQTKALCMLNLEKLNYNYAVLKQREKENLIIKNQQKRKINKLRDVVNGLKNSYAEMERSTRSEMTKLSDQISKAQKRVAELEKKSQHFAAINEKQYFDIWEMNTKTANELLEKIQAVDRIIYEETLGLEWTRPNLPLLKKEDLPSFCEAVKVIEKKQSEIEEKMRECEPLEQSITWSEINQERKLFNDIILQIGEKTGFFVEDQLLILLEKYSESDKIIIKLDNVFKALNISTEKEMQVMLRFFLPYLHCPICSVIESNAKSVETSSESSMQQELLCPCDRVEELNEAQKELIETVITEVKHEICESTGSSSSSSRIVRNVDAGNEGDDESEEPENIEVFPAKFKLTCDEGHLLRVKTAHVMAALKEFVAKYYQVKNLTSLNTQDKLFDKTFTISRNVTSKDVASYWARYREIFDDKKEKLWDALLIGLQKYHEILKERNKLNGEVESLKMQNAEMQRLLGIYNCSMKNDQKLKNVPV